jgi:hypothetical protein
MKRGQKTGGRRKRAIEGDTPCKEARKAAKNSKGPKSNLGVKKDGGRLDFEKAQELLGDHQKAPAPWRR